MVDLFESSRSHRVNLNDCHESLRTLLVSSSTRLVSLNLWQSDVPQLSLACIRSLAAGLRHHATLKTIKLPWLNLESIHVLGEALVVNRSLQYLHVHKDLEGHENSDDEESDGPSAMEELRPAEVASVLSFIGIVGLIIPSQ